MERRASFVSSSSSSWCLRPSWNGMQRVLSSNERNSSRSERRNSGSCPEPNSVNTYAGKSRTECLEGHRSSRGGSMGRYKQCKGSVSRDSSRNERSEATGSVESLVHMSQASSAVFKLRRRNVTAEQTKRAASGRERVTATRRSRRLLSAAVLSAAMPTAVAVPAVVEAASSGSSGGEHGSSDPRQTPFPADLLVSQGRETLIAPVCSQGTAVTDATSGQTPSTRRTCSICLETILATDRTVDLGCTRLAGSSSAPQLTRRASLSTPTAPSPIVSSAASAASCTAAASSGAAAAAKAEQRSHVKAPALRVGRAIAAKPYSMRQQAGRVPNEEETASAEWHAVETAEASARDSFSDTTATEGAARDYEKHEFHAACFRQYIIFSLQNVYATPIVKPTSAGRGSKELEMTTAAAAARATETEEEAVGYAGASIVQCPLPHCRREVPENIIRNLLIHPTSAAIGHCSSGSCLTSSSANESDNSSKDRKSSTSGSSSSMDPCSIRNSTHRRCSTSSSGSRRRGTERRGSSAAAGAITRQDFRSSFMTIASTSLSRLGSTLSACLQKQLLQKQLLQQQPPLEEAVTTPANTPTATAAAVQTTVVAERESMSTAVSLGKDDYNFKGSGGTVPNKSNAVASHCVDTPPSAAARQRSHRSTTQLGGSAAGAPRSSGADSAAGADAAAAAAHLSDKINQQQDGHTSSSTHSSVDTVSSSHAQSSCAAAAIGSRSRGRVQDASAADARSMSGRSIKERPDKRLQGSNTISRQKKSSRRPSECELLCAGRRNSEINSNVELISILSDGGKEEEERTRFVSVEDTDVGDPFSLGCQEDEDSAKELRATTCARRSSSNIAGASNSNNSKHEKESESSEGAALYNIYLTRSFEAYADVAGDLVRCTTPGCGYAFWWPADDEWAADAVDNVGGEVCPKCRCRCLICGLQAHAQQSCEAAAGLTLGDPVAEGQKKKKKRRRSLSFWRRVRSLDLAFDKYKKTHGLRECLQCGAVLHLESGCAKMRCRCGFKFCFVCGTPNATCRCRAVQGHDFLSLKEVCSSWSSGSSGSKEKDFIASAGRGRGQQQRRSRRGAEGEGVTTAGQGAAASASPEPQGATAEQQRSNTGAAAVALTMPAAQEAVATVPSSRLRRLVEPCNSSRRVRSAAAAGFDKNKEQRHSSEDVFSPEQRAPVSLSNSKVKQPTRLLNGDNSSRSRKEQQQAEEKDSRNSSSSCLGRESKGTCIYEKEECAPEVEAGVQPVEEKSSSRYIQPLLSHNNNSSGKRSISSCKGSKNSRSGGKKGMRRYSTDGSWAETASSSSSSSTTHSRRVSDVTDSHSSTSSILGNSKSNTKEVSFPRSSSASENSNTICNNPTLPSSQSKRSNPGTGNSSDTLSNYSSTNFTSRTSLKRSKRLREEQPLNSAAAARKRTR